MEQGDQSKVPKPERVKIRIMGADIEFGGRTEQRDRFRGGAEMGFDQQHCEELLKAMLTETKRERRFGNDLRIKVVLANGSLCYSDVQNHFEFATAECLGARELALYETAGLEILAKGVRRYNHTHLDLPKISLYKTNRSCQLDKDRQPGKDSWGSHGNFLSLRKVKNYQRARQMLGFLISRWPLIGNGWFDIRGKRYLQFVFSQRGEAMVAKINNAGTTGSTKPFIHTKDIPRANQEIWRRIHDLSGNSILSPWQLILKYGTFDLVLAMVEAENFLQPPLLADDQDFLTHDEIIPYTFASQIFNTDIRFRSKVKLWDGRYWTSLDFQRYYLKEACRFFAEGRGTLIPERKVVLEFWTKILDALERWDLPFLAKYLDWAAVLYYEIIPRLKRLSLDPELLFIKSSLADPPTSVSQGIPGDHQFERKGKTERLLEYFLYFLTSYANVDTTASPYGLYLSQSLMEKMFTREEIEFAKNNPPQKTRARLRDEIIQNPPAGMILRDATWDSVIFTPPQSAKGLKVDLPNPYRSYARPGGEEFKPAVYYDYATCLG